MGAGEGGEGGVEDQDSVAGHEEHAGEEHFLGRGRGGVLERGRLLEA